MVKTLEYYIRENEEFRQALLKQDGGIMKYVASCISNGEVISKPYAQYQEYVMENYRKANIWNSEVQLMTEDEIWLKALGPGNHLESEFHSRKVMERLLTDFPDDMAREAREFYDGYMAYAWKMFFERRNPEHATDVGFYETFMQQFSWSNGLACRCMEIVLKEHHGKGFAEDNQYDYYRIAEYHYFYFYEFGPQGNRAFYRLRQGVKDWLNGKDDMECRELAVDMLKKVRFFSQHIYNDAVVCYNNGEPLPLEDKQWLRKLAWGLGKAPTEMASVFQDFVLLLNEVGRIWAARLLKEHHIDLHVLEKETNSFLHPYNAGEDGFDCRYYVDHYYTTDSPNTCCIKNDSEAKKLLYSLYGRDTEGILSEVMEEVEQGMSAMQADKGSDNKPKGRNNGKKSKKPPVVISPQPKYMTLKYYRHNVNKEFIEKQRKRVKLLFEKWKTDDIQERKDGCYWGWLDATVSSENFHDFFEGKDKNCNLKFAKSKTILTLFIRQLLIYEIKDGNKKVRLITHQTNQSASSIVKEQFDATPNSNYERLTPTDFSRIKESIYILDYSVPLPLMEGGCDDDYDMTDETLRAYSQNIDLGIDPKADVVQAVKSGGLRKTKGI